MPLRRPLLALATAVALTAGVLTAGAPAVAAPAASGPSGYTPPKITWEDCSDDYREGFECADVRVPLNWSKPKGKKIDLAITRLQHTGDDYQGVILLNPGGPGGSGTIYPVLRDSVPGDAADDYDWIGFDPRGVGDSAPISCDPDYDAGPKPKAEPTSAKVENEWLKLVKGYARDCGKNNGAILDNITTVDVAKDMDAIRVALGQKQINYLGFSYGTYLGQVYSTLFPTHVRRMIFDGTVDPRDIWYRANLNQDLAFEKTINIWFGWVAKYDDVYHLGTTRAKVAAQYYRAKRQLDRDPVGPVGGTEWNTILLNAGYYQSTWVELAELFSAWVNDRDEKALQTAYGDNIDAEDDNGYAVYAAVQCTEGSWPSSYAKYRTDNWRIYARAPFETWPNAWFNAPCLYWPAKTTAPLKIDGSRVKSVLMINETLDAATPYPGSLEVRRRYPGARLIAEPGGTTHSGSLSGNACVDDRIAAYLEDGSLPARKAGSGADLECAPLPQPDPTKVDEPEGAGAGSGSARLLGAARLIGG